ncbi:metal ABC transporter ATP-binding protein, partial [Pseudomonas syringae]|nr:metal ABC transporter ATP-binding protein [Pseudomonas syringae]
LNRRVLFDEPAATALTPERLLKLFSAHPRTADVVNGSAA